MSVGDIRMYGFYFCLLLNDYYGNSSMAGYNQTVLAYGQVCNFILPYILFTYTYNFYITFIFGLRIFIYIQTGSGKTFTMGTGFDVDIDQQIEGRSLRDR